MSVYVIGDVQGCFDALQKLLTHIQFDSAQDTLWFTGDLVNRGPKSLETLRFVKSLNKQQIVLGNHDLHLIAVYYGVRTLHAGDTLQAVLNEEDADELIGWLRHQPLLHHDAEKNVTMVHAGLASQWSISEAISLAKEVEALLQDKTPQLFLQHMYGNLPDYWCDDLQGFDRARCIVNFLTRVRLCTANGHMDFKYKGKLEDKPSSLIPWFDIHNRKSKHEDIIFGHWAALNAETNTPHVYPLDTGCVWGNCLTALRLEDKKRFYVKCR